MVQVQLEELAQVESEVRELAMQKEGLEVRASNFEKRMN